MKFAIWEKAKNENGNLINLFAVTAFNIKMSLISLTNTYSVAKSFALLNITILHKEK